VGILRGHTQGSLESKGMKIWSIPHGDMGSYMNYNGPKVEDLLRNEALPLSLATMVSAAGYMLETPSI
jgi:hypothetical protein